MSNDAFDPQATEEEAAKRSTYMSKKDMKILAIVVVGLGAALYPLFRYQIRQTQAHLCVSNMKAIYDAVNLYAESKDDRFPPIYRTGEGAMPGLGDSGRPYTWCDDVAALMSKRYSFVCPAANPEETVNSENPISVSGSLVTSYGMYFPYSGFPRSLVPNQEEAAVFAETSNLGSNESYDPLKIVDSHGVTIPDGYVIGWDNSNVAPDKNTKFVTRLAYPGSDKGAFKKDGASRHDSGIHIMSAAGTLQTLPPPAAAFGHGVGSFSGPWAPPEVTDH